MKKFTFIAMLMLVFATIAKADDKYFFKVPTDKMASGWVIQDEGNFASTPGKDYLEVQNKKNGGRMLNYFWNEEAWSNVDINDLPNHTYKYTMNLNMSNMAARSDLEFVLLPVNACTTSDARVSTHNYRWWNASEGEDFFFRFSIGAPTAANGNFTLYFNENPTARNDFGHETATASLEVESQKTYKFSVVINADEKTATYTVANEDDEVLATGSHSYVCEESRAGIFVLSMNGTSTHQLSNIGLSYEAEGPFAQTPSVDMLAVMGAQRCYYVTFPEGHVLHWKQLGEAEDLVNGETYSDGEEYTASYGDATDTREFEQDEEYVGSKIIYCSASGQLNVWTTLETDDTNKSDEVVNDVVCEEIAMPTPAASIANVEEGYKKVYKVVADNSNTLMQPTVTIHYKKTTDSGVEEGKLMTGETITLDTKGSLELYAYDGTHPFEWYSKSDVVTVENNVEYVVADAVDYALSQEECSTAKAGFAVTEIVDAANKSHWDRIYSTQMYGYDAAGNATACTDADAANYVSTKKGFGFYDMSNIGTDNAKWNVLVPEDVYAAFSPLVPATATNYTEGAWSIFPLEGIVYYATNVNNLSVGIDSKYVSDDANKPNFYIVHTRGGYDRPDKGDCNSTTVCVAGEDFSLYRYDTAICDVKVMTYKGFVPNTTGIKGVSTVETSAPAVKKMMTKNGLVIVKGDKMFSVSGAQIK